jgi:hypothetical protein
MIELTCDFLGPESLFSSRSWVISIMQCMKKKKKEFEFSINYISCKLQALTKREDCLVNSKKLKVKN